MNTKYDIILSAYNNERYSELEKLLASTFHIYDILPFAKYILDLGYDLFDFYDCMEYAHSLDIHGYFFEPSKFKKL